MAVVLTAEEEEIDPLMAEVEVTEEEVREPAEKVVEKVPEKVVAMAEVAVKAAALAAAATAEVAGTEVKVVEEASAMAAEEARLLPVRHRPPAVAAVGAGRRSVTRPLTKSRSVAFPRRRSFARGRMLHSRTSMQPPGAEMT